MDAARTDILPTEHVRPATRVSLALVIVIVLALVIAANAAASRVLKRYPVNRGYALAAGKWALMDAALAQKKQIDVIIVGDSSSNQGLNPHVIARETGQTALNFGIIADGLTAEPVWAADRYMEVSTANGTPPKTIIWMHVYDVWSRSTRRHLSRLESIASSLPATAWPSIRRGPKPRIDVEELMLMRRIPLYYQNGSLSNLIRRPIDSRAQANRFQYDSLGFTAETTPDPELLRSDIQDHLKIVRAPDSLLPGKLGKSAIHEMGRLTEKYDVDVWIVQSPINQTLWGDPTFRRRWHEVTEGLNEAAKRFPRMKVLFETPVQFGDDQMQNCDHVLLDAANEFTQIVIEKAGLRSPVTRSAATDAPIPLQQAE